MEREVVGAERGEAPVGDRQGGEDGVAGGLRGPDRQEQQPGDDAGDRQDDQRGGQQPADPPQPEGPQRDGAGARSASRTSSPVMRKPETTKKTSTPTKPPAGAPSRWSPRTSRTATARSPSTSGRNLVTRQDAPRRPRTGGRGTSGARLPEVRAGGGRPCSASRPAGRPRCCRPRPPTGRRAPSPGSTTCARRTTAPTRCCGATRCCSPGSPRATSPPGCRPRARACAPPGPTCATSCRSRPSRRRSRRTTGRGGGWCAPAGRSRSSRRRCAGERHVPRL